MALPTLSVELTHPYNEPRDFAGHAINFTAIGDALYLTLPQISELLEVSPQNIRRYIAAIYSDYAAYLPDARGANNEPPLHLTVYEATVQFQSRTTVSGGGGAQVQKFYHHDMVLRIAERMRVTTRKTAVMDWMRSIVSQYVQHGFVVDSHALQASPTVAENLHHRLGAFNYSPQRHEMADMNNRIATLFYRCTGIYNQDGSISRYASEYFHRCAHNTAHISAVGLTALQLRSARANPTSLDFGQHNYLGKHAPQTGELKNACNFLTNSELGVRRDVLGGALWRVMVDIDTNGPVYYRDALRMITMHMVSRYNPFISWDYTEYAETALDNLVNMSNKSLLRAQTRLAIETYLTNFPNRHNLLPEVAEQYRLAEQELVNASIGLAS